jgi:hypothetical protein
MSGTLVIADSGSSVLGDASSQIVDIQYQRDPATGAIVWDASGYPVQIPDNRANTYANLQTRIANEVLGSPTTSDIQNAIQDAIGIHDGTSFYFNTFRFDGSSTGSALALQTTAGKEFYSSQDLPLLINYPHISKVMVVAFSNRYPLIERTPQWIDDNSVSTTWQGLPTDWCFEGGSLRLFPVPDGTYNLILNATIRLPTLTNGTDYNAWCNAGERLIRLEAKRLLFLDIIRDQAQAAAMDAEIHGIPGTSKRGELGRLRAETMRRAGGAGKLRASRGYL